MYVLYYCKRCASRIGCFDERKFRLCDTCRVTNERADVCVEQGADPPSLARKSQEFFCTQCVQVLESQQMAGIRKFGEFKKVDIEFDGRGIA